MVATGSTMEAILREVVRKGKAKEYIIASAITTPVAIERLHKLSEDLGISLTLYTASIDPEINDKGYIVPGLGDAGDRAFGG
jgi:uracil phosphoribosyltransferase